MLNVKRLLIDCDKPHKIQGYLKEYQSVLSSLLEKRSSRDIPVFPAISLINLNNFNKMFSGTFKVIVLVGLASVVTSQLPHARDVLIQSPQNASLCVRTKAFEWEGAQMTLLDCERYHNFQYNHTLLTLIVYLHEPTVI